MPLTGNTQIFEYYFNIEYLSIFFQIFEYQITQYLSIFLEKNLNWRQLLYGIFCSVQVRLYNTNSSSWY